MTLRPEYLSVVKDILEHPVKAVCEVTDCAVRCQELADRPSAQPQVDEHELAIFLRRKLEGCKTEGRSTYAISIYQLEELLDEYRVALSVAIGKSQDDEFSPLPLLIRGRKTT